MRKSIFYLASMAIMTIGCQAELEQDNPAGDLSKGMFTASTESSADVKTSMNQDADNDKVYNIHWTEGDKVLVSAKRRNNISDLSVIFFDSNEVRTSVIHEVKRGSKAQGFV